MSDFWVGFFFGYAALLAFVFLLALAIATREYRKAEKLADTEDGGPDTWGI